MSNLTTRKIIGGATLLITGVIIVSLKGDIPSNMLSLMENLYYAFVAGNAVEHYTEMKKTQTEGNKE